MSRRLYPLTREQEALWVEWKYHPEETSFNTCVQLRLKGDLDVERFRQAASDVVAYFDMLHACCIEKEGQPYLYFSEEIYELPFYPLYNSPTETSQAERESLELLDRIRQTPLDLTAFPLTHAALIQSASDVFYFIGVVPHIISDGASALYFLQALSVTYNEGKTGLSKQYDSLRKDWSEYLEYRTQKYPETTMEKASQYWQSVLKDAEHYLPLTQTKCSDVVQGKRIHFSLNPDALSQMKAIASHNRTSLFSVIAALYAAFLYRYYEPETVTIGYPVNLRPAGYRHAFGLFVNVLPLVVRYPEDVSLSHLVSGIDKQRRSDKRFQYLPSLDIVRAKRQQEPSFNGRMVNVSMAETISRLQNLSLNGIESKALQHDSIESKDDLSLIYEVSEQGIDFWFEYREAVFSENDVQEFSENFTVLATQLLSQPDQHVSEIPLVTPPQKAATTPSDATTIQALFEAAANVSPDACALTLNGESMSYAELNAKSNRLAHYLIEQQPENRTVALITDRSFERIIAMLAVLKAGCAYIPIEPETPEARVAAILADSDTSHVLSDMDRGVKGATQHIIADVMTSLYSVENPLIGKPEDIAYVIYTSGSTGTPKGVVVSHRAVTKRLQWLMNHLPLNVGEAVLQNTSYSFDVSVADIFWPLASGAHLVLIEHQHSKDMNHLAKLISLYQVVALCMVPSAFSVLLSGADHSQLASLRSILLAGEAVTDTLVKFYKSLGLDGALYNVYGPTEATVYATWSVCQSDKPVTIGVAIDDCEAYVFNSFNQLQPAHATGELCLGGDALAEGYYNRIDLTAERFIDNPFGGGKLYRTSDKTRLLPSGELEYLGRLDDQVKLRGYRIELGEINAVLLQKEGIEDIACTIIQGRHGRDMLVCYYAGEVFSDQILQEFLASRLPDYMIPQTFVTVNAIPRLESGKINRKALSKIEITRAEDVLIPPQTEQEHKMLGVWARSLRLNENQIGVESDFYALGGDSLMTIEVASMAAQEGMYFNPQAILLHRTIKRLLPSVSNIKPSEILQSPVTGRVELLPRHRRFFTDGLSMPSHWNRCIFLESTESMHPAMLEQALRDVVQHHDGLRLSFSHHDTQGWQAYNQADEEALLCLDVHDLTSVSASQHESIIVAEANQMNRSLVLSNAPLLKASYLQTSAESGIVILVIHHLLVDMRSCRIILEDLLVAYRQLIAGIKVTLPPKTTSVQEWSQIISQQAKEVAVQQTLPFWMEQLRYVNHGLPTKTDISALREADMHSEPVMLDIPTTKALQDYAKNHQCNVHETLLSVFAEAYHRWSGAEYLSVNTCGHGRDSEKANLQRTVGWLNTVYPVSFKLSEGYSSVAIAERLRNVSSIGQYYSLLRHIEQKPELCAMQEPAIFFNYVSRVDSSAPEMSGIRLMETPKEVITVSHQNRACYALYIEAALINEQLYVSLGYNVNAFSKKHIRSLLSKLSGALKNVRVVSA